MATIHNFQLFENKCSGCGKVIKSHATNRQGALPEVYCNRACESTKRMNSNFGRNIVESIKFS